MLVELLLVLVLTVCCYKYLTQWNAQESKGQCSLPPRSPLDSEKKEGVSKHVADTHRAVTPAQEGCRNGGCTPNCMEVLGTSAFTSHQTKAQEILPQEVENEDEGKRKWDVSLQVETVSQEWSLGVRVQQGCNNDLPMAMGLAGSCSAEQTCIRSNTNFEEQAPTREDVSAACLEAFRHHSGDLITIIEDPEVLAWYLYGHYVVCSTVVEEVCMPTLTPIQRKTRLLKAVKDQIEVCPAVFGLLLLVLKTQPYLADISQKLEQTYQRYRSQPPITRHQRSYTSPHSTQSDGPTATYASYLKSVYLRQKFPTYGKLPHSPTKRYTNLASVKKEPVSKEQMDAFTRSTIHGDIDDVAKKKEPIAMEEIATVKGGVFPKCILVEGAPGIGKSTFAWKMCRKWGNGRILQDYRLVVLLSLRERKIREATTVSDFFQFYDHDIQEQVTQGVKKSGGKGVLLLFDGYDELSSELRTQNSLLLDVIQGKELPQATVLITSRPSASRFLYEECKDYLSQHIEILGFTSKNVQSYLQSTCGSDPSLLNGIKKYLQCYPHIRTLMYVPLNAAIVVEVYRNSKKDQGCIPRTMTQLYENLVCTLLRRYLKDHLVYGRQTWRIRTLGDIPSFLRKHLCKLGIIAYNGIENGQQVVFEDLPDDFETLGLMRCIPELYVDDRAAVSHSFLHLTIQEFLAAFHLSQLPAERQVPHFENKALNWRLVLRFLAGLTGRTGKTSETPANLCQDMIHMIFEAQAVSSISEAREITVDWSWSGTNTFDSYVLGYCVSHSHYTWNISLRGCHIGDEEMEGFVQGVLDNPVHDHGSIAELQLDSNNITLEGVKLLLELPLLDSSLKTLHIGYNHLPPEGIECIIAFLQRSTRLMDLDIASTHFCLANCVSLSSVLVTSSLEQLLIVRCGIGPDGAQYLAGALCDNSTLRILNMDSNPIGVTGAAALAKAVTVNKSLRVLSVHHESIGAEGTRKLLDSLLQNTSLVELWLPKNKFKCVISDEPYHTLRNTQRIWWHKWNV